MVVWFYWQWDRAGDCTSSGNLHQRIDNREQRQVGGCLEKFNHDMIYLLNLYDSEIKSWVNDGYITIKLCQNWVKITNVAIYCMFKQSKILVTFFYKNNCQLSFV